MSRLVDVTYPPIHERRQRVETVGLWELDDCSKQLLGWYWPLHGAEAIER
jgi:hypothetical protein